MLARLQRWITVALVSIATLWAGLSFASGHAAWAPVGALAIALGYAAFMAFEFAVMTWQHGSDPAPRPTWTELMVAWWGEVTTSPRVFCWEQPFRERQVPDQLTQSATSGCHGVVLVHGFVCNRAFWHAWMPRLAEAGVPYLAPSLEPVFTSIGTYADRIEAAVREMEAATGRPPVVVAHSMGGLAVRAWLAGQPAQRVRRVITIGTPHHGTWAARWSNGPNARDMRHESPFIRSLEAAESATTRARFTCFYGNCDNIVYPPSTATLADADNHLLAGTAHVHMVDRPEVFEDVLRWCRPGADAAPSA